MNQLELTKEDKYNLNFFKKKEKQTKGDKALQYLLYGSLMLFCLTAGIKEFIPNEVNQNLYNTTNNLWVLGLQSWFVISALKLLNKTTKENNNE